MKFKVLYYVNQFFGQVGGEDKAGMKPEYKEEVIGPALGFNGLLGDEGEVVGTLICGDNYFNENNEESLEYINKVIKEVNPDIVVAGPAFNAGRYGMACAGVVEAVNDMGIKAVTGMYIENPALDTARANALVVETTDSAGGMRDALPKMAGLVKKLMSGEEMGTPEEEGYIAQGKRLTVFSENRGSKRAVDMLLARFNGEEFETELPMPVFDKVEPAAAIKDLSKATIALVTSGGMVPEGNPDRIQSASAQIWGKYDVSGVDSLKEDGFITIHGGFDPVYANDIPDRIAPLDLMKEAQKEGKIGDVYKYFYTTSGTGTSVGKSVEFGTEIGKELKEAGVDGVILTST